MPDRIEHLERLNRLRADGALSDQEFEREKRRLLGSQPNRLWLIAVAGFICVVALLAWFLFPGRRSEPPAAANRVDAAAAATEALPTVVAPSPPPPLDISSPIRPTGGACGFAPDLQRAFDNMLHYEGGVVRSRQVRFGPMRLTPSVTSRRDEVDRTYESVVTFNEPVIWNGLRLIALRATLGTEWGSSTLEFSDNEVRVRAALQRMAIRLPASGSLELPSEGCPNAIAVRALGTGAALSCGGGRSAWSSDLKQERGSDTA